MRPLDIRLDTLLETYTRVVALRAFVASQKGKPEFSLIDDAIDSQLDGIDLVIHLLETTMKLLL